MDDAQTLDFPTFWQWLTAHPSCILRAGTPESVLYDDDDYHWDFVTEAEGTLVVQVIRGKRLVGELLVVPEQVAYVQTMAGDQEGESVFELITETDRDRFAAYYFVLAHGLDSDDEPAAHRVH